MAAIGDSFTAGIGAGEQLGDFVHRHNDWVCSRYDGTYPMMVLDKIGSSIDKFQYHACSGDRSMHIFDQANNLHNNDIDLVIMTAGGNDLCLAQMIKMCIMIPFYSEDQCNQVIAKAQENIDTILKDNLKQILEALDAKMAEDGIVVYNGYAEYFNEETDACTDDEIWYIPKKGPFTGLKLTKERRKKFNALVRGINDKIKTAIEEVKDSVSYKIGFSNWDPWPRNGVDGQYCSPSSTGEYPDKKQPDLQFFKLDTHVEPYLHDELRRREAEAAEALQSEEVRRKVEALKTRSIYESVLYKSPDPRAIARSKLDARAPEPPGCPGDDNPDTVPFPYNKLWDYFGLGAPDSMGKLFHPNEEGHRTIASFAMAKIVDLRAEILGVKSDTCTPSEKFTCWSGTGSKGYASVKRLDEHYGKFCDGVSPSTGSGEWTGKESYDKGTPDEHEFVVKLAEGAGNFDKALCKEAFARIIHGCDGGDHNPLNWKYGGEYQQGLFTYQINIKRDNRPPLIKEPYGSCFGTWYPFEASSVYKLKGKFRAGWSTWDWGQKTLLSNARSCVGGGLTQWKFKYYDEPDEDGMEWESSFRTVVWVGRCFKNEGVQKAAGGLTNGCSGTDVF
ncbi:Lipase [Colletotrichum siamense]|uniref:Lipase n=1 Tax=Colletotrichum siamense TaxID=690259 RepID=A0A9P5BNX0_COLSI|nr:Lipase [Colletotrichum siamense]KAF4851687.1 Lipase [Colletotrichum siamense]